MFKNRSIQMKFVKDAEPGTDTPDVTVVDPEQIAKIATEYTIKTITVVTAAIAANRVLKTVCEIAVVAAKAKLK
jgi:hypothetical protein